MLLSSIISVLILNVFEINGSYPKSRQNACSESKVPAICKSVHAPFPSTACALLYCLSLMLKCIGIRDRTVKNGHKTIKTRFGRRVADVGFVMYSVCIRTENVAYFCSDFKGTVNTHKKTTINISILFE